MQCKQSIRKLKQNEVFCIMEKMTYNQTVKEAIAIALVQLMKSKNFEDISVSEIVKIAGVGRSSRHTCLPSWPLPQSLPPRLCS